MIIYIYIFINITFKKILRRIVEEFFLSINYTISKSFLQHISIAKRRIMEKFFSPLRQYIIDMRDIWNKHVPSQRAVVS